MNRPFEGLYLHIPFCVKRCAYCDFPTNAVARDSPRIDDYVARLAHSIELSGRAGLLDRIRTIYVGGGTPSYIGTSRLRRLLETVRECANLAQVVEFTLEANPDSFDEDVAATAAQLGVNRFSIGVQSTDDDVLRLLGRVHDGKQALRALRVAGAYSGNVSADIICGAMNAPGKGIGLSKAGEACEHARTSRERMLRSLQDVVDAGVSHVSAYPLSIEEGTPLERAIEVGELPDVDEDEQAEDMLAIQTALAAAKPQPYKRYEISNYALPGCESIHNTGYWTGAPYLGLGLGAASMFDASDTEQVLASEALGVLGWSGDQPSSRLHGTPFDCGRIRISTGGECAGGGCFEERLTRAQAAAEDFMLAMRLADGIERGRLELLQKANPALCDAQRAIVEKGLARWVANSDFASGASCNPSPKFEPNANSSDLGSNQSDRLVPTKKGWLLGNEMFCEIWDRA